MIYYAFNQKTRRVVKVFSKYKLSLKLLGLKRISVKLFNQLRLEKGEDVLVL